MEETTLFILLVVVMFVGSYVVGSMPLLMPMSEEILQLASALGAGMLVGTALAVNIPEGVRFLGSVSYSQIQKAAHGESVKISESHSLIGIPLILGFLFMLLIDHCSASRSKDLESTANPADKDITATVGLVVHAAADGVAFGAAATTSQAAVEMIVFIAIMLHKAPEAFGLTTFLLREGMDRNRIKKNLIVFALSAPVTALFSYFGIGQKGKEVLSSVKATGLALLFSAGTFVYVATAHVLPELTSRTGRTHRNAPTEPTAEKKGLRTRELIFLIVGSLFPLLLTVGHHH